MYKHVFGPVPSRRLGISLGVDLVVSKSCNLNCIFCECGATKKIQLKRQRFKDMNEILNEIQSVLKDIKPDYVTFSGSGEPTLSLDLGNISKAIKKDLKFKGKIWIEIFILENINDSEENFIEIADFLNSENIRYDKIQLNTIDRVGAERDLKAISFDKILKAKRILEENGLHNIEIIKSLNELEENQKIQVNQELLDNMKQKRLYQEEEINKIFKKT